uniref:Protein kinase domain-containing protein n=1 Tax=Strongyloides papillosus TaxID=174720 RepID=A0A0N5B9F0_STREA
MPEEGGAKKGDNKQGKALKPSVDATNNLQADHLTPVLPLQNDAGEEDGPINLQLGTMVAKKYQIIDKLGEGGCGSVYVVKDTTTQIKYAMKSESLKVGEYSVLKLEVQVMKRLGNSSNICQLITSGKNDRYSYMVVSLLGHSLFDLLTTYREFSISTSARAAIQALAGLKQLHDVGFIHRDVKTENLAIGKDNEKRIVFLLDFGLVREYFFVDNNGKVGIRKPREKCQFRGTLKYASIAAQDGGEQGRKDDIWGLLYCVGEFFKRLPWDIDDPDKALVKKIKKETPLQSIFKNMPEMINLGGYLDTLTYYSRPDYKKIYSFFKIEMDRVNAAFEDPYDWELDHRNVPEQLAAAVAKRLKGKDPEEPLPPSNNNVGHVEKKITPIKKGKDSKNVGGAKKLFYNSKDVIFSLQRRFKNSKRKRNRVSVDNQIINDNNVIATVTSQKEIETDEKKEEKKEEKISVPEIPKPSNESPNFYENELGKNDIGF